MLKLLSAGISKVVLPVVCRKENIKAVVCYQRFSNYKGNRRLIEVGTFDTLMLQGQYEPGQLFYHKVFEYRGIILFSWQTKVYDKDLLAMKSITGSRPSIEVEPISSTSSSKKPKKDPSTSLHTYYIVLIDGRDQDCVRVRTRSNPLTLEEVDNDLIQWEGVDSVSHDDVLPYTSTARNNAQPIQHPAFNDFFTYRQEPGKVPECIATDTLFACRESVSPVLRLSSVYKETTENVRVTVVPFYIGSRSTSVPERTMGSIYQLQSARRVREYWWRYCIRLENLGQDPVQLRERKWCIYTKKMNTINGRGVVGEEPVLSKEHPAFQYVSMISLDASSGHMWGKYKMEQLHSGVFFDCEIPNFALDSKYSAATPPHSS